MNEYHYYGDLRLKKCENPLCERLTTALHCCHACDLASGKYEIHEDGLLGHSEMCNARFEERKGLRSGGNVTQMWKDRS